MDRAGWKYPSGDLRVSDADRERALHELSGAFQAGLRPTNSTSDPGRP